jgi:hypothetical protein
VEESEAKLQAGVAFRLQPDGQWTPEKIPPEALKEAKFSGYLTIQGYRCTVFEMPDKSQWAQKSTGTAAEPEPTTAMTIANQWLKSHGTQVPPVDRMRSLVTSRVASRVAARWLLAQGDITSLVERKLDRSGEDDEKYDKAIVDFVTKARKRIEPIDAALQKACDVLLQTRDRIEHKHPRVQDHYVQKFLQELAQKHRELEDMRKQLIRGLSVELDGYESEANAVGDFIPPEVHQTAAKLPSQLVGDEFQVWSDIDGTPFQFHTKNGKLYMTKGEKEDIQDAPGAAVFDTNKAEEVSPENADHAETEWTFVEDGNFSLHT